MSHPCISRRLLSLSSALLLAGGVLPAPAAASPPRYIDLADRLAPGESADDTAYQDLNRWLAEEFTDACPDAFCEGEFGNYRPLRLNCVVDTRHDQIHNCRYAVVASRSRVNPGNGAVTTELSQWHCPVPLPAGLSAVVFLSAMTTLQLDSSGYLFNRLPGSSRSLFDVLRRCLP